MMLSLKSNKIKAFSLSLFASLIFWVSTGLHDGSGFGTDMTRYFEFYYIFPRCPSYDLNLVKEVQFSNDILFNFIFYLSRCVGLEFSFFLLFVSFCYYWIFCAFANKEQLSSFIFLFAGFLVTTFWMTSLVYVVLRQGVASVVLIYLLVMFPHLKGFKAVSLAVAAFFIHSSMLVAFPFVLFNRLFLRFLTLLRLFFLFIFVLYFSNLFLVLQPYIIDTIYFFGLNPRSLIKSETYIVGMTYGKAAAIILPVLLAEIAGIWQRNLRLKIIYAFYLYVEIVGMMLSGLPYNDRIMLIGWVAYPFILIPCLDVVLRRTALTGRTKT